MYFTDFSDEEITTKAMLAIGEMFKKFFRTRLWQEQYSLKKTSSRQVAIWVNIVLRIWIQLSYILGFIGIRYPSLLLRDSCKRLYKEILSPTYTATKVKFTVMRSLQNHLMEEENRLQQAEKTQGV